MEGKRNIIPTENGTKLKERKKRRAVVGVRVFRAAAIKSSEECCFKRASRCWYDQSEGVMGVNGRSGSFVESVNVETCAAIFTMI
jgi:hypothetical protein